MGDTRVLICWACGWARKVQPGADADAMKGDHYHKGKHLDVVTKVDVRDPGLSRADYDDAISDAMDRASQKPAGSGAPSGVRILKEELEYRRSKGAKA